MPLLRLMQHSRCGIGSTDEVAVAMVMEELGRRPPATHFRLVRDTCAIPVQITLRMGPAFARVLDAQPRITYEMFAWAVDTRAYPLALRLAPRVVWAYGESAADHDQVDLKYVDASWRVEFLSVLVPLGPRWAAVVAVIREHALDYGTVRLVTAHACGVDPSPGDGPDPWAGSDDREVEPNMRALTDPRYDPSAECTPASFYGCPVVRWPSLRGLKWIDATAHDSLLKYAVCCMEHGRATGDPRGLRPYAVLLTGDRCLNDVFQKATMPMIREFAWYAPYGMSGMGSFYDSDTEKVRRWLCRPPVNGKAKRLVGTLCGPVEARAKEVLQALSAPVYDDVFGIISEYLQP